MSLRAVAVLAAGLLALSACTMTVHYAVLAPPAAAADDTSCFRQCQITQGGETNRTLGCLRHCPDVRVVHERKCGEVWFDATTYTCSNEHSKTFSPGPAGIFAILLAVVLSVAIATY